MQKITKAIFSKRTLFLLCFLLLNVIELLRSGPSGDIWYVANNCTGIVMMFIVFSGYKQKDFFTISNLIWSILCVIFMVILPFHHKKHMGEYLLWQVETAVMNIWWLFIVIKHLGYRILLKKDLHIKFNALSLLWITMMLFMFFSKNENNLWPLWFLIMFSVFYLTPYSTEDRDSLWSGMVDGNIVGFFVLQIYAYYFRPYDTIRYSGYAGNSNVAALYYLIIYVMCLFKLHQLHQKKAKIGYKIFYLLGAGGMLSFQFLTIGRTAWILSIIVTLLYGILVIKKLWNQRWKQVIYKGVLIVAFMLLTFLPVFYTCRWLPTITTHRTWYGSEYFDDSLVHYNDPPTSEKYTELDELLEAALGRVVSTIFGAENFNPFVLKIYAASTPVKVELLEPDWLKDYSLRVRLTIWKAYLENLTWNGHLIDEGHFDIGDENYVSWHGQNLWIHIIYYYGIPVGILLIIITILLLFNTYKKINLYNEKWYSIVPFFICIIFFGYGLMESVWDVGHLILFLIFFVHLPFVTDKSDKQKNDKFI